MKVKCENCEEEFTFLTENESYWEHEQYKFSEIKCPNCEADIIIKHYKPIL